MPSPRRAFIVSLGMLGACAAALASAQDSSAILPDGSEPGASVVELSFTPAPRAQLAVWIESADGTRFHTVRLTEAVALRGIGNRPGASQMNSGFRWPYGRREGVLPIWASRRAAMPGARSWKRVIFQDRRTEGLASRTANDFSRDDYYCLSFARVRSSRDALDAVSCASVFNSDKGRFITDDDVAAGYAEPYEDVPGETGRMRPLSLESLYPPRRDVSRIEGSYDHPDLDQFASHAREVMPDIDAVTMATPVGGKAQRILFSVPSDWEHGDYRACVEANTEGDYNSVWNDQTQRTPLTPISTWDTWATGYGYPYRGQPSVVYCVDFTLGSEEPQRFATDEPAGSAGTWLQDTPGYGELAPMDGMTDDPVASPGSGADRLQLMDDGDRLQVLVKPPRSCMQDVPPGAVTQLRIEEYPDELHAHQFARLRFSAAGDDLGVFRYDVRFSTAPIVDDATFMQAEPAKEATLEGAELRVPTEAAEGEVVAVDFGGLVAETRYYVAVRAMDACAATGPIAVAELTTPKRVFATVTPCFVATAAYGSPLAAEIGALRRFRDRYLLSHALGRAFVSAYYEVGPVLARKLQESESLRSAARWAIKPLVVLARALDDGAGEPQSD